MRFPIMLVLITLSTWLVFYVGDYFMERIHWLGAVLVIFGPYAIGFWLRHELNVSALEKWESLKDEGE